jgi:hypothetical protein
LKYKFEKRRVTTERFVFQSLPGGKGRGRCIQPDGFTRIAGLEIDRPSLLPPDPLILPPIYSGVQRKWKEQGKTISALPGSFMSCHTVSHGVGIPDADRQSPQPACKGGERRYKS